MTKFGVVKWFVLAAIQCAGEVRQSTEFVTELRSLIAFKLLFHVCLHLIIGFRTKFCVSDVDL